MASIQERRSFREQTDPFVFELVDAEERQRQEDFGRQARPMPEGLPNLEDTAPPVGHIAFLGDFEPSDS